MSPPWLRRLGAAFVVILVLVSSVSAQTTRRGPRGRVRILIHFEPEYAEARRVRVSVFSATGGVQQTAVLNGEHACVFDGLGRGEFVLELEAEGFHPVESTFTLNPFSRLDEKVLTVTMNAIADGESVVGGKTVTVEQLSIPDEAKTQLEKAARESAKGRPERAVKHLERAIEIYPEFYQAYNNLAVELQKLGLIERAVECLKRSIELEPGDAVTHLNLAEIQISGQDYDSALHSVDRALGLDMHNPRSLRLAGEAYLGLNACQLAVPYFLTASSLDSEEHSYLGLARCFLKFGDIDRASQEMQGFLKASPNDPRVKAVRQTLARLEERSLTSQ